MSIEASATASLDQVTIRPIADDERERFDHLLETVHYLGSSRLGVQHLRYVAEVDGQWVALLAFSGAAPHLKARENVDRLEHAPAGAAPGPCGQQQPLPAPGRTRAPPQPGLQGPRPGPAPAFPGLGAKLRFPG